MPTLTPTTVLQRTLASFSARFPMIRAMSTDFSTDAPLRLNQTVIAHVRQRPSAASYDATTGYANGATSARTLLADLPILIDGHKHVPVYLDHLDAIKDQKDSFNGTLDDQANVLGEEMVNSIFAKATGANFSYSKTYSAANSDLDAIASITSLMNENRAAYSGRVGVVNSAVAETLELDTRVASKDYYGVLTGDSGLRVFRGIGGFSAIYEYPGLDDNNAATQTFTRSSGNILTATAHGFETGDRVRVTTSAADLPAGLAVDTTYYVIKLTADTFSLAETDALATAGTAITLSDAGTGTHSVVGYENVTGIFFESRAFGLRAGLPSQSAEIAQAMGIPQSMVMEFLTEPDSGFSLAFIKWMQQGTMDLYSTVTSIWGSAAGRQAGAAGALTDKAAVLLRSA